MLDDKFILAFSQASYNLFTTLGFLYISNPVFFLNSPSQYSKSLLVKSSPPKLTSPFKLFMSTAPSPSISNTDIFNVPAPKSKTHKFFVSFSFIFF